MAVDHAMIRQLTRIARKAAVLSNGVTTLTNGRGLGAAFISERDVGNILPFPCCASLIPICHQLPEHPRLPGDSVVADDR